MGTIKWQGFCERSMKTPKSNYEFMERLHAEGLWDKYGIRKTDLRPKDRNIVVEIQSDKPIGFDAEEEIRACAGQRMTYTKEYYPDQLLEGVPNQNIPVEILEGYVQGTLLASLRESGMDMAQVFPVEVRFDRSHEFNPEHHKLMVSFTTDKYIAKGSELDNRIDKTVMQAKFADLANLFQLPAQEQNSRLSLTEADLAGLNDMNLTPAL